MRSSSFQTASRAAHHIRSSFRNTKAYSSLRAATPYALKRQQHFLRSIAVVTVLWSGATAYTWANGQRLIKDVHAEAAAGPIADAPAVFEESRKVAGASKEETRNLISSQHLQVIKSWQNPGVWCWGSNEGRVAAPDAEVGIVKAPRWLPFFDGKLLRDLKLTSGFGAAIAENGDLLQWGEASAHDDKNPVITLKGKDLVSLTLSKDRILALGKNGTVYSLSVDRAEQVNGPKPSESSAWIPGYSSASPISYRTITPTGLSWGERVTSIAGGLDHALILTSKGRVFAAASGSEVFPTRGQMGIPGLTWFTRPPGPYDQAHEIQALHGFKIKAIAAGDYHSLALDDKGRAYAWGDNQKGQLGIGDSSTENVYFDTPTQIPITRLYAKTLQKPSITQIFAGGNTTFFTVDAERIAAADADSHAAATQGLGRITADVWACGHGIWGQLGNGRWTHVQALPTKILPLSGLFEYDEVKRRAIPIRMRGVSIGANHCAATMDNVTYTSASEKTSEHDTNWGADVLFFGNNEFYQLGTGKRNNIVTPTYIQPLDRQAETLEGKRPKDELHRFHATPLSDVKVNGRWVKFEQRVVCGRGVTAVYSGL